MPKACITSSSSPTARPAAYSPADLPHGVPMRHRDEMDAIQRDMRECPGVSAIIYDQTCAAEKRRRRKRGRMIDPPRRLFINEAVCEGCGDCGTQSNCLAVVPVETGLGRKRAIDQSACNKDYSCEKGFCPSFVSVIGGSVRKGRGAADPAGDGFAVLPAPTLASTALPYGIVITGVGGTGVVTLGALIGMAAHIDGKGVTVLDMTGLAQKGGAVFSHVRICDDPEAIHAVRVATGDADALIGGDLIVSASPDALTRMQAGRTRVVVNCARTPTADFTRNPDWQFPLERMQAVIGEAVGETAAHFVDASDLAFRLLGDSIAGNLFLLGYAWQKGLVPVSWEAMDRAIELNGTAVAMSRAAFLWGRRAALDAAAVAARAAPKSEAPPPPSLDELIASRERMLTDYQDAAYAARYRDLINRVRAAECKLGSTALTEAVARNLHKLMAIKDEYEVARLYSEGDFRRRLDEVFDGDYSLRIHLAPPLLARPDPKTGKISKLSFGPLDVHRVQVAGQGAALARHRLGCVRPQRRAPPRAQTSGRLRSRHRCPVTRFIGCHAGRCAGAGETARHHPRLRPCQAAEHRRRGAKAGSLAETTRTELADQFVRRLRLANSAASARLLTPMAFMMAET
jgi:indolepyruvate ferredoxin oxidoreductase